ncbi:MAG TPA: hypothetical protein VJX67_15610, partial [Blastocatellia bacterium]|nr:hypothetical protein [Blastocatellia bacterium]
MNLRVSAIDRVADNAYRLTLEAGRRTVVYVVTVAEQPVPAMQAPDSLWQLLDNEREPIKNLVDAVFQVHWRRDLALPVIIRQPQTSAAAEASDLITWPVRTGRWNLSKTSLRWAVGHLATQRANTLFPVPFEQKLLASA